VCFEAVTESKYVPRNDQEFGCSIVQYFTSGAKTAFPTLDCLLPTHCAYAVPLAAASVTTAFFCTPMLLRSQ